MEHKSNTVYQLNCEDYEAVYMGETKRTLSKRAEEHIRSIKSASKGVTVQSTAGNTIIQLTKRQHHQTESTKVPQQVWFHTGPQLKSTSQKYFDPLRTRK